MPRLCWVFSGLLIIPISIFKFNSNLNNPIGLFLTGGQIRIDPPTTEILAGASGLKASVLGINMSLVVTILTLFKPSWTFGEKWFCLNEIVEGLYFHSGLSVCLSVCLCVRISCEQNSSQTDAPIMMRFSLNGCLQHWLRPYWNWWPFLIPNMSISWKKQGHKLINKVIQIYCHWEKKNGQSGMRISCYCGHIAMS